MCLQHIPMYYCGGPSLVGGIFLYIYVSIFTYANICVYATGRTKLTIKGTLFLVRPLLQLQLLTVPSNVHLKSSMGPSLVLNGDIGAS